MLFSQWKVCALQKHSNRSGDTSQGRRAVSERARERLSQQDTPHSQEAMMMTPCRQGTRLT